MNLTPLFAETEETNKMGFSSAHFNITVRKSKNGAIVTLSGVGNADYVIEKQVGESDLELAIRTKEVIVSAIETVSV